MKTATIDRLPAILIEGLALLCGLGVLQGFAQAPPDDITTIPLEELSKLEVYSASKFSQKATEAPASITIITAADIQHYGYRTFAEILNSVTGFFVTDDRNYNYAGVRGFGRTGDYNTRILILVNGLRLNENIYGGTGISYDFTLNVDLIERVEIVRGPSSSLYGTNAFFGIVNVITKRGRNFNGGYLSAEAGSRKNYAGTASYGGKFNSGVEVLLSGTYRNSKGEKRLYYPEFDTPETNNGIAENLDAGSNNSYFAHISYRDLTAQFVYNTRDKGVPTASYGAVFNYRGTFTTDTVGALDIKFERGFRANWNLLARTYFGLEDYNAVLGYSSKDGAAIVKNIDIAHGRWWGGEFQLLRSFAGRHHIVAGTEWQYSPRASQHAHDEPPYYHLYLDTDDNWSTIGGFIQGDFALRDNLLLSGGFRHDHYSTFGGNTSPRFALVYSPQAKTTAKILYGHAYRAPNNYELRYTDNYSIKNNPELQPEEIRTLEFVLEQYLGRQFRVAGSAYRYTVAGLISQEPDDDDLAIFRNIGKARAHGMEIELEGKNFRGFDGRISYALQRAENASNGASLANSPRHIAQLNLYLPCFSTKGGAGLEMRYMGARKTLSGNKVGGFLLVNNTFLYKKLLPKLDLSASIYNIFDKRYSDPAGEEHLQDSILQDGRSFRIRLGYVFASK
jgi:outer membrane receptor for ferrienterochelin and colicins